MLYLRWNNSKKQLYINLKALGQVLFVVGYLVAYLYLSNQDYLSATGQNLIKLK